MGIIENANEQLTEIQTRGNQLISVEKSVIIDAIMEELPIELDADTYEGSLDYTLVHYFGRRVFEGDVAKPYQILQQTILQAESQEVPILLTINPAEHPEDREKDTTTALILVDPNNLKFRSEISHRQDVKMHAFTDDTANVTDRKLSLIAETVVFNGELRFPGTITPNILSTNELVLGESHTAADGKGQNHGPLQFRDSETSFIDLDSWDEPYVFVGWKEIAAAFERYARTDSKNLLLIGNILSQIGKPGEWEENMPKLAEVVSAAKVIDQYQSEK